MLEIALSFIAAFGTAFALKIACLEWKDRLRQFRGFEVNVIEKEAQTKT